MTATSKQKRKANYEKESNETTKRSKVNEEGEARSRHKINKPLLFGGEGKKQ
jgi:hypothetical protein